MPFVNFQNLSQLLNIFNEIPGCVVFEGSRPNDHLSSDLSNVVKRARLTEWTVPHLSGQTG